MVLKTHRQGNDFKLTLQVYRLNDAISVTTDTVPDGAIPEDLTEAQNIKLSLYCSTGACTILKKTVNVNTIVAEIPTNIQDIGTYFVLLEYDVVDISFADGLKRITVDFDAFKIVCKSAYADVEGDMSLIGVIKVGLDGKSAYQYAQEHGYTGTEEEFGQLQYEATLAAINEAERVIAESNREQTFNTQMDAVDTAIVLVNSATNNANLAATNANDKATLANNAATNADSKSQLAETAASNANTATGLANAATANANNAASNADSKAILANNAAINADAKATLANNAAINADTKASLADQKATLANDAAIAANTATGNANTATTNANSAALAANSLAGTYNVTVAIPLGAGFYYTSTTARAAVPTANRLLGRVITYATASSVWITEKFIGADVVNWTVAGNWERVPDNSQIVQLGADLNKIPDNLEPALAEILNQQNKRIEALENLIKNMLFKSGQFDTLEVVKEFNIYGKANLYVIKDTAPSVVPDFRGQVYINTSGAGTIYQAKGISSTSDWKQTSN